MAWIPLRPASALDCDTYDRVRESFEKRHGILIDELFDNSAYIDGHDRAYLRKLWKGILNYHNLGDGIAYGYVGRSAK